MNICVVILIAITSAVLVSCSSTKFTTYRGTGIVQGKGGTVRTVDGIDFWENGDPDRKYKVLGVIDDSRGDGLIANWGKDSDIARKAREYGGDAVILIGSDRKLSGIDLRFGSAEYQQMTKFLVVQYMK
jgi:hypothetical protein